ncbi:MAG: hypothetical protein AVDCRST_MAG14-2633, partial [uncultured Rubrobacteraceae bacterium]
DERGFQDIPGRDRQRHSHGQERRARGYRRHPLFASKEAGFM